MPAALTYPGVYVDEVKTGGARPIGAVPTSVAAFVGTAPRGGSDEPAYISSWADFEREFGGFDDAYPLSAAVYQFYLNGGAEAHVVRVLGAGAKAATIKVPGEANAAEGLVLKAKTAGAWGDRLRVRVEYPKPDPPGNIPAAEKPYDLVVRDTASGREERFSGIVPKAESQRSLDKVLSGSDLVAYEAGNDKAPEVNAPAVSGEDPLAAAEGEPTPDPNDPNAPPPAPPLFYGVGANDKGSDGDAPDYKGSEDQKTGLYQLLKTDIFNLLCVLPDDASKDVPTDVLQAAAALCLARRAFLVVDPPLAWKKWEDALLGHDLAGADFAKNAALYYPRVHMSAADGTLKEYPPSGAIAGVYARTDAQRGVWKAPAGTEATINGAVKLSEVLTDRENGRLNPLGVNCLRVMPGVGRVSWGARTMRGADSILDDPSWRYIPIRRLALFIEESLYRGTQWVVFEPNDEPLWSSVRLSVGAFMNGLFRQGAFQGSTPREAYLVKCDKENNPQSDIDRGILNILVGFAPLKPAEFVLIHIQQLAGQSQQ
jgi:phage tail sheath protein FI